MTPKSWMDACGSESKNSNLRIVSDECINDHLHVGFLLVKYKIQLSVNGMQCIETLDLLATLTMGIWVVYVQAMSDAARRTNMPRKTGEVNIWSNPRVRINLQVKTPNTGFSSGYFLK